MTSSWRPIRWARRDPRKRASFEATPSSRSWRGSMPRRHVSVSSIGADELLLAERLLRSKLGGLFRLAEHLLDMLPIDEMLEERLEVVGPAVAIIDVVGVLPHVAAENGLRPMHERVFAVRRFH